MPETMIDTELEQLPSFEPVPIRTEEQLGYLDYLFTRARDLNINMFEDPDAWHRMLNELYGAFHGIRTNPTRQNMSQFGYLPYDFVQSLLREQFRNRIELTPDGYIQGSRDIWTRVLATSGGSFLRVPVYPQGVSGYEFSSTMERLQELMSWRNISSIIAEMRGVPRVEETPEPVDLDARVRSMDKFRQQLQAQLQIEDDPFRQIVIPEGIRATSRTWGIEIEHPDTLNVPTPAGWDYHHDSSVASFRGTRPDGSRNVIGDPREWTSPILRSFHSGGLRSLTADLEGRGINDTAGVHVHVGALDLNPRQIASLLYGYNLLEPLWYDEYARDSQQKADYADTYSTDQLRAQLSLIRDWSENPNSWREEGRRETSYNMPIGRYFNVNLMALENHGTIEFRAMGPRYEYDLLVRWAYFCREFVSAAKGGAKQKDWEKVRSFADLLAVFARFGGETDRDVVDNTQVVKVLGDRNDDEPVPNNVRDLFAYPDSYITTHGSSSNSTAATNWARFNYTVDVDFEDIFTTDGLLISSRVTPEAVQPHLLNHAF